MLLCVIADVVVDVWFLLFVVLVVVFFLFFFFFPSFFIKMVIFESASSLVDLDLIFLGGRKYITFTKKKQKQNLKKKSKKLAKRKEKFKHSATPLPTLV